MNKLLHNFFRPDINLSQKWWHRLLKAIYFVSITIFVVININSIYDESKKPIRYYSSDLYSSGIITREQYLSYPTILEAEGPDDQGKGLVFKKTVNSNNMFSDLVPKVFIENNKLNKIQSEKDWVYKYIKSDIINEVLLFLILFLIYYKVILYVIFGNKKH